MSSKRSITNHTGVYTREHETRRFRGKPDICYDICYRLPGNRKLIWEKVGWSSEKISAAIASNLRAERIRQSRVGNLPTEVAKLTLDEVFERFRTDYLEVARKRPHDAVCIYNKRIRSALGALTLHEITANHVDSIKKSMLHLSPQSVKHTLTLLGEIYRQAVKWGIYEGEIPTTKVKIPQRDNRRMRFLTKDEARRLLGALRKSSPDLWRMAVLSLYTGMRAGEIFNLRWEHVNFSERTIAIMDGKGEQSRVAHMTDQVLEVLQTVYKELSAGHKGCSAGRVVFPKLGTENEPRSQTGSGFQNVVRRDTRLNEGITDPRDKVVFHTLRHTFASWLVQAGVPLYTVQRLMGHKSVVMTQRYAHLAPDQGKEAARLLSGIL
jgi:integrase